MKHAFESLVHIARNQNFPLAITVNGDVTMVHLGINMSFDASNEPAHQICSVAMEKFVSDYVEGRLTR